MGQSFQPCQHYSRRVLKQLLNITSILPKVFSPTTFPPYSLPSLQAFFLTVFFILQSFYPPVFLAYSLSSLPFSTTIPLYLLLIQHSVPFNLFFLKTYFPFSSFQPFIPKSLYLPFSPTFALTSLSFSCPTDSFFFLLLPSFQTIFYANCLVQNAANAANCSPRQNLFVTPTVPQTEGSYTGGSPGTTGLRTYR